MIVRSGTSQETLVTPQGVVGSITQTLVNRSSSPIRSPCPRHTIEGWDMFTVIFAIRVRADADLDEVAAGQQRMLERVGEIPSFGFLGATPFMDENGDIVMVARFAAKEGLEAWRADPEHRATMERGWADWLDSYWGGEVRPRMHWDRQTGRTGFAIPDLADEPVTIVFCLKLREDADADAFATEQFRMLERLSDNPVFGFRGVRVFQSEDGTILVLVEFDSPTGLAAWNADPQHRATMERGRTEWVEYGWTGELVKRVEWAREKGRTVYACGPADDGGASTA